MQKLISLGCLLLLAGCVAEPAEKTLSESAPTLTLNAKLAANAPRTNGGDIAALVPVCVKALETGQPISNAHMTQLGFIAKENRKSRQTYRKAHSELSMVNARDRTCNLTLGRFENGMSSADTIRSGLLKLGYQYSKTGDNNFVRGRQAQFRYVKGSSVLWITGFSFGRIPYFAIIRKGQS